MSGVAILTRKRSASAQPRVKLLAPPSPSREPSSVVAFQELQVNLALLLDDIPHPTFVLDKLHYSSSAPRTLPLVFYNAALRNSNHLFRASFPGQNVSGNPLTLPERLTSHKAFMEWMFETKDDIRIGSQPHLFHDQLWTSYTTRSRWLVVQAISFDAAQYRPNGSRPSAMASLIRPDLSRRGSMDSIQSVVQVSKLLGSQLAEIVAAEDVPVQALEFDDEIVHTANEFVFDRQWQNFLPNRYSPHVELVCRFDWASTPLGPMSRWSMELRLMCSFVLTAAEPMVLFWSDAYVPIYNEGRSCSYISCKSRILTHATQHMFLCLERRIPDFSARILLTC
jgi:hypothetical protein